MTLVELLDERRELERRLDFINVRCSARDRLADRLERINARIAQIGY